MSSESCRCGEPVGQSAVWVGRRLFCSPECYDFWSSGRDMQALERIDALEASNDANLAMLKEAKRLLDLREKQLADCTRAMRKVATEIVEAIRDADEDGHVYNMAGDYVHQIEIFEWCAKQLDAVRAGKAAP